MPIQGVGKNENFENGHFAQKMLHKRLGVQDQFTYSLDFMGKKIEISQMAFFFVERENFN